MSSWAPGCDPRALLGHNALAARKGAHMSQSQVAAKSAIHFTEVSRIERGLRDPRVTTIIRLARALGVPPGRLLEDDADRQPQLPLPPAVPLASATLLSRGSRAADDISTCAVMLDGRLLRVLVIVSGVVS